MTVNFSRRHPGRSAARSGALQTRDRKGANFKVPDLRCTASGTRMDAMEGTMKLDELNKVAQAMVAPGKGILAADEFVWNYQEAL